MYRQILRISKRCVPGRLTKLRAWQADEVEMPGGAGPNLLCCESRLYDCFQEGVGRRAGG